MESPALLGELPQVLFTAMRHTSMISPAHSTVNCCSKQNCAK